MGLQRMRSKGSKAPRKIDPPAQDAAASKCASEICIALAAEFYAVGEQALDRFGVSPEEKAQAHLRNAQSAGPANVSGPFLRDARGLAALLLEWTRSPDYCDSAGQPSVLPLRGSGATFETLVKRFMSANTFEEALGMATATAEVLLRPGGKIALIGGVSVKLTHSAEHLLAHAIRHMDQLLTTITFNLQATREGTDHSLTRMERLVIGAIRQELFPDFMYRLRPQIYNLLQQMESTVEEMQPTSAEELAQSSAVMIGVYVAQEADFDRAGIDPVLCLKPPSEDE
jgi:hypothetical protein